MAKRLLWAGSLAALVISLIVIAVAHSQIAAGVFFVSLAAVFLQVVFRSTEPERWRPL